MMENASGSLPVLYAPSGVRSALNLEQLRTIGEADLAAWLAARRWFGSKAANAKHARILDSVKLPSVSANLALCRLTAELGDGRVERYQLPLMVLESEEQPQNALARVKADGASAWLCDAAGSAHFARALLGAYTSDAEVSEGGTSWRFTLEPGVNGAALADTTPEPLTGEQSNSSIRCGNVAMLKLYRKLEAGPHPEVEMTRYLTRVAGFDHVPQLLGVASVNDGHGGSEVVSMLQALVPNAEDCWDRSVGHARKYMSAPGEGDPPNPFGAEALELGRVTREMHEALAAAAVDDISMLPQDADVEDVATWVRSARTAVFSTLDLLADAREAGRLEGPAAAAADAVLRRRKELVSGLDDVEPTVKGDGGLCIRIHGDYHLGQVLRGGDRRFWIMDFEGEPARLLAERRGQHSALRDVAGMLRSFAYAAATAARLVGGVGVNPVVELRLSRWERAARAAFIEGYEKAAPAGSTLLPRDDHARSRLLDMFEAEKVFYELAYELNNRPEWTWIPLRGIARLLGR